MYMYILLYGLFETSQAVSYRFTSESVSIDLSVISLAFDDVDLLNDFFVKLNLAYGKKLHLGLYQDHA